MLPLRRHQLVRLTEAGWAGVLARPWDAQARGCVAHWAAQALPLVVTRQPADLAGRDAIALGLPAPLQWERRRLALQVAPADVLSHDEFPTLGAALAGVASKARDAVRALDTELRGHGVTARVFGSHGWQQLTGLAYLRPGSDLDLWLPVDDVDQADAVAASLHAFACEHLRLDGELVFGDGSAVAWREWAQWRGGSARAVLVKQLQGVALHRDAAWCAGAGQ